ncbi:DUF6290 family protein [Corynebacterium pilbarense]|uniref:DUF6290 family protein n=1 Tax=Corynebacterium pilbarense TaxID=1288393 RepID=A0A9Q4IGQ4_9CORY|nr:DUF6290 family protein [Corynebacterium pilbarense]MCZ2220633.1 DUF6290 family protein [Corynebacterium pilbarense]
MFLRVRLSSEEASLVTKLARAEGVTVSEFARSAIAERIEDLQDLQELRSAVEFDSDKRFTMDEIYWEFGR